MGYIKNKIDKITEVLLKRRNNLESIALRRFFLRKYGIDVGLYSYGCFDSSRIPKNTIIGRYCSFVPTVYIFNGNHGTSTISTHPYLYNVSLGMVSSEKISRTICVVEDDVWLGHNSVILPNVTVIGRGAVIAAGAVVTKNVPRYAIVAGNPANVIRYRFDPETIDKVESSEWWSMNRDGLERMMKENADFVYCPSSYKKENAE